MSMAAESDFLDVKILGREYRIACPAGEQEALQAAVQMVDGKMQEIAHKTRNTVPERVAVMAALNIAHEYLSARNGGGDGGGFDTSGARRRIEAMETRLDALLAQQKLDL
ncbi:cell division protein ZapA [Azovibrio restrictus]|jgi:cell division protein ZapA|uniref:cell division protein ZapA n=1 Tax=Azovibrio restrictus TaxID=146938 RepID=UPI0026F286B6|nr:cell division protein ZapA [Azovibrio restrictus]